MTQSRQTAFKICIYDLKNNQLIKETGEWAPNYILFNGNKISRVNVIANVIIKNENADKSYSSILLDDGTETIRAKCWRDDTKILDSVNVGNVVILIGRIREFNNEIYITPEIIKPVDYLWTKIRKFELDKLYGKRESVDKILESKNIGADENMILISEERISNVPNESNRQRILSLIEKFDSEIGADKEAVISSSGFDKIETNRVIDELLKEGEVFQIRPGKLKLIS